MLTRTAWRAAALLLAFAVPIAACGGGGDDDPPREGTPREFLLGLGALPRELNAESYEEAIAFAGDYADLVLIQREMPWADFLPGAPVNETLAAATSAEADAIDDHDLTLFFAIDATDGASGRDRLVGLPPALEGRRFDDPDVRSAFVSYAEYVAINYEPRYLALGVEMNLYYESNREDWPHFLSLYREAFDAVKRRSPETQVTVTLQYEDLQGLLPRDNPHFADWQLVRAFEPELDFVAISTYPSFAFGDPAAIPENYYSQLRAFTDRPIAIADMGYASAAGPQGVNSGTEEDQAAFLARALRDAESMDVAFAVWFAIWDPVYAADTEYSAFQSIGLRRQDDSAKPAWAAWERAARRPLGE